MEQHIVKILSIEAITHNVNRYRIEKPSGYKFTPGQATDVSINTEKLKDEKRSFTFTSLNDDSFLEFTIKSYNDHEGVTNALGKLKAGNELIIGDVWGAIHFKGPGVFIAGGAGVTPFIAILRDLNNDHKINGNKLMFSNKTTKDIILKDEFEKMLGDNFFNIISDEKTDKYETGYLNKDILKKHAGNFEQYFYICGPPSMIDAVEIMLKELGTDEKFIVKEDFS
ncbi:hypothetical protein BH10BAC5_BH10BAC5_25970 [soil metagenome]